MFCVCVVVVEVYSCVWLVFAFAMVDGAHQCLCHFQGNDVKALEMAVIEDDSN